MIYGYNFKNQLLNPDKLAMILNQANYGYMGQLSGIISENSGVVTFSKDDLDHEVTMVVAGNIVGISEDTEVTLQNNTLVVLRVYKNDFQTSTSILNQNIRASLESLSGVTSVTPIDIEGEPVEGFYEVRLSSGSIYRTGYALESNQYFEVPIYVNYNGTNTKVATYITKTDYKEFLNQDAVQRMWAEIEQTLSSYLMDSMVNPLQKSTDYIIKLPKVTSAQEDNNDHMLSDGIGTKMGNKSTSGDMNSEMPNAPVGSIYFQII